MASTYFSALVGGASPGETMNEELILNNLKLIYKVINDLHITYRNQEELEDYYSIGLIGLIKAARNFNANRKSTYLYNGIKYELIMNFINKTTQKRKEKIEYYQDFDIENLSIDENFEEREINKMLVEWLLSKMKNQKDKEIIIRFYGIGCDRQDEYELARLYKVSHQRINQRRKKGLKELKKILEEKDERKNKKDNFKN